MNGPSLKGITKSNAKQLVQLVEMVAEEAGIESQGHLWAGSGAICGGLSQGTVVVLPGRLPDDL